MIESYPSPATSKQYFDEFKNKFVSYFLIKGGGGKLGTSEWSYLCRIGHIGAGTIQFLVKFSHFYVNNIFLALKLTRLSVI